MNKDIKLRATKTEMVDVTVSQRELLEAVTNSRDIDVTHVINVFSAKLKNNVGLSKHAYMKNGFWVEDEIVSGREFTDIIRGITEEEKEIFGYLNKIGEYLFERELKK